LTYHGVVTDIQKQQIQEKTLCIEEIKKNCDSEGEEGSFKYKIKNLRRLQIIHSFTVERLLKSCANNFSALFLLDLLVLSLTGF